MKRRRLGRAAIGFAGLIALVVVLMLVNSLRPSPGIVLPSEKDEGVQSGEDDGEGSLSVVEIRPDTVQAAVATLVRPESYRREVVVQQFWDSGQRHAGKYRHCQRRLDPGGPDAGPGPGPAFDYQRREHLYLVQQPADRLCGRGR